MPTKTYYLNDERTQVLTIKWGMFFRNMEALYNGQSLGTVPSTDALRQGHRFALPDGRSLQAQLVRNQGLQELELRLDGQPVPGSTTHPRERIKQAWYTLLFVGGLNVVLGLVAVAGGVAVLLELGLGWGSLLEGLVYLGLGWWGYTRLAPVAFGIAMALLVIDGILTAASGVGVGGLVARFFFCVLVYRGMQAARQLRTEQVPPAAV